MQRRHGELVFLAQSPEQRGVALSRTARRELTGEELVHSLARHAGQRAEQRGGDAEGQRQQRVGVHGERHGVDQRGLGDHPRHLGDARHRFKMFLVCQFFKMLACHRSCQRGRRRNRRAAEETREANARGAKGAVGRPGERRGRPDVRRKRRVVRCAARAEAKPKLARWRALWKLTTLRGVSH